jgi:hypothetical protein
MNDSRTNGSFCAETVPATVPDYDVELAAVTACITALAEHGIPVDIQEVLVNGSLQAGIKPHAIFNGIRAAYNTYMGNGLSK